MHELVSTGFNFKNENMEMIYFRIFDNHLSTLPEFQNVEIVLASGTMSLPNTGNMGKQRKGHTNSILICKKNIIDYLTTKFYLVRYKVTINSLYFLYSVKTFQA